MRSKGFRFPSPLPQTSDPYFRLFAGAPPSEVYNPWPQLVDRTYPEVAWAQPLIRAQYIPVTSHYYYYQQHGEDPFNDRLSLELLRYHEEVHLYLDSTPAKEYARLCLAYAYDSLRLLLSRNRAAWDSSAEKQLSELRFWNDAMTHAAEAIGLAEELVATAFSFALVESSVRSSAEAETLIRLEKRCVTLQAFALGGPSGLSFLVLYDDFRKLARLICEDASTHTSALMRLFLTERRQLARQPLARIQDVDLEQIALLPIALSRLGIFLEPLTLTRKGHLQVPDSFHRCRMLANLIEHSGHIIDTFLQLSNTVSDSDTEATAAVMRASPSLRGTNMFIDQLWKIGHGISFGTENRTAAAELTERAVMNIWVRGNDIDKRLVTLVPTQRWHDESTPSQWHVIPRLCADEPQGYVSEAEQWIDSLDRFDEVIFYFEGLRQQIDAHIGIRCPLRCIPPTHTERCECKSMDHRIGGRIRRLAKWAMEGRLGEGEWTALPFPCGQGN